ncbi:MAG: transcription antitermination factor NusB, partial [Candidatus Thorarchaeota archaeon]
MAGQKASGISMRAHLREMASTMKYKKRIRGLVETLVMGTTRYRNTIDFIISRLSRAPRSSNLNTWERDVLRLVVFTCRWVGADANQILSFLDGDYSRFEGVAKKAESFDLEQSVSELEETSKHSILLSHPSFIVKTLFDNLPKDEAIALMRANNQSRSIYLRPNMLKADEKAIDILAEETSLQIIKDGAIPGLFKVEGSVESIVSSKMYKEGLIILQDKSSVIAVKSLSPQRSDVIWDACAAPGMKTQLIMESMGGNGRVAASDIHLERLRTAMEQSKLYGLGTVSWLLSDSTISPISGASKILIDAPCSSTGMVRSHPSLKWRLNKETLFSFMTIQNKILDGVITEYATKPGTEIVYATCSILPHEGESQIDSILNRHK